MNIIFDIGRLNKKDQTVYEAMTDAEKASFEKTWILLEEQKLRLSQKKNAAKERASREKKALAVKERKERTHRLIDRGAILEANIKDPIDFSNDEIKEIVEHTMQTQFMRGFIEEVRNRHHKSLATNIDPFDSYKYTSVYGGGVKHDDI